MAGQPVGNQLLMRRYGLYARCDYCPIKYALASLRQYDGSSQIGLALPTVAVSPTFLHSFIMHVL